MVPSAQPPTTSVRRISSSIALTIVGHAAAGSLFWFTYSDKILRGIWLPQFYVLLAISCAIMVYAISLARNLFRIIALLNALIVQVVISYPEGADLRVRAVLGSVFVVVTMFEIEGPFAYIIAIGYAATVALDQINLTVWGSPMVHPSLPSTILAALYFGFLTWFAGLVGGQAQRLTAQRKEIARLDHTVTSLSQANIEFQVWGTRLQRATEEQERKRIAREIHDVVGHTLTNIQMMMEAATDLARRDTMSLQNLLVESRDQAHRGLMETRRAMRNLRTATRVQPKGLSRIVEVARIFEDATKVVVDLNAGNVPASFGAEIDDVVYRVVQEGLTNAIRHGNASRVSVSFWVTEGSIRISIKDNGVGSKEVVPGVGLIGMSERLSALGGRVWTESNHYGFSVFVELPFTRERTE